MNWTCIAALGLVFLAGCTEQRAPQQTLSAKSIALSEKSIERSAARDKLLDDIKQGRVPVRSLKDSEKQVIEAVVKDKLKDPDSAKFDWPPLVGKEPSAYCGLVNAKNSFGGYSGKRPYIVVPIIRNGIIRTAVLIGMATVDANSSENQAIMTTCSYDGYIF